MSKAEELLSTLVTSADATVLANTSDEPHIIIGNDRFITVPESLKRLAVQYDHDIETVTFDCPRYWDEHDMSEMHIYINYLRADKESGVYKAQNVSVDEIDSSIMHFTWTISRNVTEIFGPIAFLVCVKKANADGTEKNHWNSEICRTCIVSEGLEIDGEGFNELYADIIEQWHTEVLNAINESNTVKQSIIDMRDSGKFNGATFTPSVSSSGYISWTNDKNLSNPETRYIRGPNGFSPTIKTEDIQGGHKITITDVEGTTSINIMDGIIGSTEAVKEAAKELLDNFVYIGDAEPASSPVLWFDTINK